VANSPGGERGTTATARETGARDGAATTERNHNRPLLLLYSTHPIPIRNDDDGATTDAENGSGAGAAASAARAARTGSQLSPRRGSPRAANNPSSPFSAGGGGGGATIAPPYNSKPRQMGVLEFEADAGTARGPAVFPPSDDDEDDFGLLARGGGGGGEGGGGGGLRHGSWGSRYPEEAGRWRLCRGLVDWWRGRGGGGGGSAGAGGINGGASRCCRQSAIAAACAALVALAVVLLGGGDASALFAPAPYEAAAATTGTTNPLLLPRLPRVKLPPPPLAAAAASPYCSWDSLQLPGVVRPLRYTLHLSAQLADPYAVQGVARIAVEAAEPTPCVVMHAALDEAEVSRVVAAAAAFVGGGGGGGGKATPAAATIPGRLPTPLPPLARPWRPGKGAEQGMRILSARLYFDGDALEEGLEQQQQQQQKGSQRGAAAAAATAPTSAWAFPSPAVAWPAQPPATLRSGVDYVDGAVYNASSSAGQVALLFPRALRSYGAEQRDKAAADGKALPVAMLEISFNYTLGTGLDGFYRSSWTGEA
jgi:hypothetical protein